MQVFQKSIEGVDANPFLSNVSSLIEQIPNAIRGICDRIDLFSSNFNIQLKEKLNLLFKESQMAAKSVHDELNAKLKNHSALKANARTAQDKFYSSCQSYVLAHRKDLAENNHSSSEKELTKKAKKVKEQAEKDFKDSYVHSSENLPRFMAGIQKTRFE